MTDQLQPVAGPWHVRLFDPWRSRLQPWPVVLPSQPGDPIRPLALGTDRALIAMMAEPVRRRGKVGHLKG
jgi:hypothetical protein